jgi:putative FmdB family regulatory protein
MPKYDYICDDCNHEIIDLYQSIYDESLTECPSCGKKTLRRVIYGGLGSFMKDPKTIGGLADINWSKMGHYQKSEIEAQSTTKTKNDQSLFSSCGNATKKEINNMSQEQKTRYIMEGKK